MNNIILELREKDKQTTNYSNGDWGVNLNKSVIIENGDVIRLSSAFVDTTEISTQYISIDEPLEISMSFWLYNINWQAKGKCYGRQFTQAFAAGPDPITDPIVPFPQGFINRQDGDPYFLCEAIIESFDVVIITEIKFEPFEVGDTWGDCFAVFKYRKALINPTAPYAPTLPTQELEISVYIPPQSPTSTEYIYESSFAALRSDGTTAFTDDEILSIDETLTSKPLREFSTRYTGITKLDMADLNNLPQDGEQTFLIPVQNNIRITIPAGKYLPQSICNLINAAVTNFDMSDGIGQAAGATIRDPPSTVQQALPFNPSPLGLVDISYGNAKGMPTFTQSNYFPQTTGAEYLKFPGKTAGGAANWANIQIPNGTNVLNGDMFMSNYHPIEGDTSGGNGIQGGVQIYNFSTVYPNRETGDNDCTPDTTATEAGSGQQPTFIGASQFALEFNTNNIFEFRYLHTPLYLGKLGGAGTQASDICNYRIRMAKNNGWSQQANVCGESLTSGQGAYGSNSAFGDPYNNNYQVRDPTVGPPASFAAPISKFVGSYGGICFSSLTPHSFWIDKLGFDLKEMRQDKTTGKITQKGILTHYQLRPPTDVYQTGAMNDLICMVNFKNSRNNMPSQRVSNAQLPTNGNGISPILPIFPFLYGVNATSGIADIDSVIIKDSTEWWKPVDTSAFGSDDENNGAWTIPSPTIIGDETTSVKALDAQLLNLLDGGYYLIEIDTKLQNEMISSEKVDANIQGLVNRYYSQNSYTSSDGSNIEYTHRGEPMLLSSVGCRILNPDHTLARVGPDSTIFLMITKRQAELMNALPVKQVNKK